MDTPPEQDYGLRKRRLDFEIRKYESLVNQTRLKLQDTELRLADLNKQRDKLILDTFSKHRIT